MEIEKYTLPNKKINTRGKMLTLINIPESVYLRAIELKGYEHYAHLSPQDSYLVYATKKETKQGLEQAIYEYLISGEGYTVKLTGEK